MKKIASTLLFLAIIIPVLLVNASLVYADDAAAAPPSFVDQLRGLGNQTGLPGHEITQHGQSAVEEGVAEMTSPIYFVIDFVKYLLASIAVLMLVVAGVKLVIGGEEEEMTKQKNAIMYALGGLMIVILADVLVKKVFFGEYGEAFQSEVDAKLFAEEGAAQVKGIYNFIEIFVASVAVLSIIYSGIRMLISAGEEEVITKHRTHIFYALGGLVLIGLAEFAVKEVIFPETGNVLPRPEQAKLLIKNITNFISGFIAIIAVLMYIYGGYLYVIAGTDEENINKAKKVLISATVGILIAGGAFAITRTLVSFDPLLDIDVSAQMNAQ